MKLKRVIFMKNLITVTITMLIFLFTFSACKVSEEGVDKKSSLKKTEISNSCYILHCENNGNLLIIHGLLEEEDLKEVLYNIHCDKVNSIFAKLIPGKKYKDQFKLLKDTLEKHKKEMKFRRENPTAYMFEDYGKGNY